MAAVKRLTAQQVADIRLIIQDSTSRAEDGVRRASSTEARAFYGRIIARNEGLLEALPERGGVDAEDSSDEQRGEE